MPAETTATAIVKIKGMALDAKAAKGVVEVRITRALNSVASCTVRLATNHADVSDIHLGDEVTIEASIGGKISKLFTGEIRSITLDLVAAGMPDAVIECHDQAWKLASAPLGTTLLKKNLNDAVGAIAAAIDVGKNTSLPDITLEYQVLPGTALEALDDIIRRTGYVWLLDLSGNLVVKQPFTSSSVLSLDPKNSLTRLRARMSAVDQAKEVRVKGWDADKQEELVGAAATPKRTGQTAKRALEAAKEVRDTAEIDYAIAPRSAVDQDDADAMAQGLLDQRVTSGIQGWGETAIVVPEMEPGTTIEIDKVGAAWIGDYPVSRVEHVFSGAQSFFTRFDIGPPDPPLSQRHGGRNASSQRLFDHLTIGVVTQIRDESGQAPDVKVTLPFLTTEQPVTSNWARVVTPGGGGKRGLLALPEVNDEVVVGFENGDPDRPFVLGGVWSPQNLPGVPPTEIHQHGKTQTRSFITREGHQWSFFDDEVGSHTSGFRLELNNEAFLELNVDEVILDSSKKPITIKGASNSEISIDAQGNITIKGASLKVDAQQKGEIKTGSNLDLKAGTGMKLDAGTTFEAKAGATGKVEAGAPLTLKGAIVKVN